jgi:lipopolysaccharide export system protein LptC
MKPEPGMNRLIAAQPDNATARSYWTMSRNDSERAFRSARKHSRHVRWLRTGIPAAAVVVMGLLFLWKLVNPVLMIAKLPENPTDLVVSGTKITMEAPRLSGFTRDSRGYELTAAAASQDISKPDIVELRDIRAKLQMLDKSTAEMTARDGTYDSKNEVLKLGRDVILTSSSGYKAWLNDATVDVRTSDVVTDKPVEVQMLQGMLNAQRLEVKESGDLLRFEGGVRMKLKLHDNAAANPAAPAPAPDNRTRAR